MTPNPRAHRLWPAGERGPDGQRDMVGLKLKPVGPLRSTDVRLAVTLCAIGLVHVASSIAPAQQQTVEERTTVSVLNRYTFVEEGVPWVVDNVPANGEQARARLIVVKKDGTTLRGTSDLFVLEPGAVILVPPIVPGVASDVPLRIEIFSPTEVMGIQEDVQLQVTATFPDGSTRNVTGFQNGTVYTSSKPDTERVVRLAQWDGEMRCVLGIT